MKTGRTFITSDLHLRHGFVAHLRGFASPAEHDAALRDAWKATVGPKDLVMVLGDVHVGDRTGALREVAQWSGRKRLIVGNHDLCHPMHARPAEHARYAAVFEQVLLAGVIRHEGRKVLLSHMPYEGDHTDVPRFVQWRLPDLGVPIIHGHTHSRDRVSLTSAGTVQVHAGVDAWGMSPTLVDEVLRLA